MSATLFNQKNNSRKERPGYNQGTNSVDVNSNVSGSGFIVKENTEKIYSLDKIMYISGNDVAFADNVIKLFIQLLQESIQNVREALRNNDVQLLKKTVHKIKPGLHTLEIIIMDEEVHAVENLNADNSGITESGQLFVTLQNKMEKVLKNINFNHVA